MSTVTVPAAGDVVSATYGAAVANAINDMLDKGFQPFAYPIGLPIPATSTQTTSLTAVAASKGGALLCPFDLFAPMKIQSVTIRNASTASARTGEFALYTDDQTGTLTRITGTDGTFSYTPAAIDDRTANVSTPGTVLAPGVVWLCIRNTSAAQSFQVRRTADPTEVANNAGYADNTPNMLALGATFSASLIASGVIAPWLIRLNGRVFGVASAF